MPKAGPRVSKAVDMKVSPLKANLNSRNWALRSIEAKELVKHTLTPHQLKVFVVAQAVPVGSTISHSTFFSRVLPVPTSVPTSVVPSALFNTGSSSRVEFTLPYPNLNVGKVATYGSVAKVLGSSPRAVGQALRHNPLAPTVPCHRVVAANGRMGGFSGETCGTKIKDKIGLLKKEGVQFAAIADESSVVASTSILDEDALLDALKVFLEQ